LVKYWEREYWERGVDSTGSPSLPKLNPSLTLYLINLHYKIPFSGFKGAFLARSE